MKDKKAKWEISCDGYYPYCTNCYFEPYHFVRANEGSLPDICPKCGAKMTNANEFKLTKFKHVESGRKCFAIDFDGTLVVGDSYPNIGEPNWPVVNKVKRLQEDGHEICLWTCRQGEDLNKAVDFCKNTLGLIFDEIMLNKNELSRRFNVTPCKLAADYYIDDRALSISDFLAKDDYMLGTPISKIMSESD